MTAPLPHEEMLERQLARLTTWQGTEPELWRTALAKTEGDRRKPVVMMGRFLTWPVPKLLAASLLVLLTGVVIAALLPSLSKARSNLSLAEQRTVDQEAASALPSRVYGSDVDGFAQNVAAAVARNPLPPPRTASVDGAGWRGDLEAHSAPERAAVEFAASDNVRFRNSQDSGQAQPSQSADSTERSVIRKATIELTTEDVRSAFLKAMHLVSEAGGEYIQDSALSGSGKDAQANITLRVGIDRLSAVLNDLRNLGTVRAESINGEDVTAQVVDLEARLRNEQRVEAELLQLLEKRNDAPLKEILELRSNIGQARQYIEQIVAQREKLSRLVALATVLVIIKPEPTPPATAPEPPKPPEPKKETIGQYFGRTISADWQDGLHLFADTLAGAVKILVGGLIWWAALVAGLLVLRQHLRRKAALAGV
jgi:hypothetical protein